MSKIIEKIQKVLELAKRGGTEDEAATALKLAHELLAKHNLSMSEVESHGKESDYVISLTERGATRATWQNFVIASIAKLYFCKALRTSRFHILIGKPENVAVAQYVIKYVIQVGTRLAKQHCTGRGLKFHTSFKKGFANRIDVRVEEEIRRAKNGDITDSDTGTALILHPLYARTESEIEGFLENAGIKPKTEKAKTIYVDGEAFNSGELAANDISLKGETPQLG